MKFFSGGVSSDIWDTRLETQLLYFRQPRPEAAPEQTRERKHESQVRGREARKPVRTQDNSEEGTTLGDEAGAVVAYSLAWVESHRHQMRVFQVIRQRREGSRRWEVYLWGKVKVRARFSDKHHLILHNTMQISSCVLPLKSVACNYTMSKRRQ